MPEAALKKAWTRVAFGDVVRLSRERSSNPEGDRFARYVGLEHIDPGDLKIRRWGETADGTTFTSVFRPGQVLFGKRRAYQRKVAVADFSGVCSGDIYVLEPKNSNLLPELLPFICQTDRFFEHAIGTSAGSLSPRTNWNSLATYEFALPPLQEQRRLVDALSELTGVEEAFIRAIVRGGQLEKAAIGELFDPTRNGWKVKPIGEVFKTVTGGTPDRTKNHFWGGGIPWVKTGEVKYSVVIDTEEHITESGLAGSAAKVCPARSVLVALYGQGPTRGRVAMLGVDAAINQACAAIFPNEENDPWFVYFYLTGKYLALRAMAQGAAQPNLNLGMIKNFPIPTPPLEDQRSKVATIRAISAAQERLRDRLAALRAAKTRLQEDALG